MSAATGSIPQSNALAEAQASSVSELMSRDPATLTRADRDRMVAVLREQRARWEAGEKGSKPKGGAKAPKIPTDFGNFNF